MMKRDNMLFSSIVLKSIFYNTALNNLIEKNKTSNICEFNADELYDILKPQLINYNHQELNSFIKYFLQQYKVDGYTVDIFDILFYFADIMISFCDGNYKFKYEYTDIWRDYTKLVDEEVVVISAILQDDMRKQNYRRTTWDWPYCIEHNNHELTSILSHDNGVSENHFHLRGSSAYFYISWILLMNNVFRKECENKLLEIDSHRLKHTNDSIRQTSLVIACLKAAAIRLYLYSLIISDKVFFEDYYIEKGVFDNDVRKFGLKYNDDDLILDELDRIPAKQVKQCYCKNLAAFERYKKYCDQNFFIWLTNKVLACNNVMLFPTRQIEELIVKWKSFDISGENIDYAQQNEMIMNKKYFSLSGERFILYETIRKIRGKCADYRQIESFLYLYLHVKHQLRVELVQSNNYIGFHNFQEYQARKDSFIERSNYNEEKMVCDTICSLMEIPKIHRVELRISPDNTAKGNDSYIQTCDKGIERAFKCMNIPSDSAKELKNKFYYTLHFIKGVDKDVKLGYCRNYDFRDKLRKQAKSIIKFRNLYASTADRVLGIDAAGEEIDCRPENFGTVFRLLQYYDKNSVDLGLQKKLRQIRTTYHVGEDNYDIVDALRAIDEAILFLGLRSGSRLGHATLLGISAWMFYDKKKNSVHMPRQIFLDNIVWMYYFIKNNSIYFDDITLLMSYLEEQFHIHFNKIFLIGIQSSYVNNVLKQIPDNTYYNTPINSELCKFDIYNYYLSWLLRGDDPELYINGYYKKPYTEFESYRICRSNEKMFYARNSFEAVYLYYLYHYNTKVRMLGDQKVNVSLPDYFIKAVKLIQKSLTKKIEMSGIAIETNPSSNLFISTIDSYDEHPISYFYDSWLNKNPSETQLNVSINTDDKSVFSTCLSNEYAYLAFYLENKKDENGKPLYNRFEIYNWLDAIRRMGNEQSFGN